MPAPARRPVRFLRMTALALALAAGGNAWSQGTYDSSPEVKQALQRLATEDPQVQATRWGVLATMAGKSWLSVVPGDIANIWRRATWVVPGSVLRFQRGFCIALKCQASDYLVQYNDKARQLELFEDGSMAYTGHVQDDGSVRLKGTGLVGVLTAETLRFDAAKGAVFADAHELQPATTAQVATATRGFVAADTVQPGTATAAPVAIAVPPGTPASGTPGNADADLRAELAAMRAKVDQLSRQLEQSTPATAPASAPQPRPPTPAEAKAKAREEARARAAEAQRLAAERRAQAEDDKRLQAEAKARQAQEKAAEARRLAEERRAQKEAARLEAEGARRLAEEQRLQRLEAARREAQAPKEFPHFGAIAAGTQVKNGGWATDAISQEKASAEALANCRRTGDTCAVVLVWTGRACGTYRMSKDGKFWGAGVHRMISESASMAFDEAYRKGAGETFQTYSVCNSHLIKAEAEMVMSGPPPRGSGSQDAQARKGASGPSAATAQSNGGGAQAAASDRKAAGRDDGLRAGTYKTATGYSIEVEVRGDSLIISEPNKKGSEYRRIAPGSNVYKFINPTTGTHFAMTVVDSTSLVASRFGSSGEVLPNGTPLKFAGGNEAQAVDSSTYRTMEAVAQKYLQLAQTDPANAQAWSFCGLAAMATAHGQGESKVQEAAMALKTIATTTQTPCPDAISPAIWNRIP